MSVFIGPTNMQVNFFGEAPQVQIFSGLPPDANGNFTVSGNNFIGNSTDQGTIVGTFGGFTSPVRAARSANVRPAISNPTSFTATLTHNFTGGCTGTSHYRLTGTKTG